MLFKVKSNQLNRNSYEFVNTLFRQRFNNQAYKGFTPIFVIQLTSCLGTSARTCCARRSLL